MTLTSFYKNRYTPDVVVHQLPGMRNRSNCLFSKHVEPAMGGMHLTDISYGEVQDLCNALIQADYAVATVVKVRALITSVLKHAQRTGALGRGPLPTEDTHLPAAAPIEKQPLTWPQVLKLCQEVGQESHVTALLIQFLCRTGLRVSEAIGLRWQYVNLSNRPVGSLPPRSIAVRFNYRLGAYGPLKTPAARRFVPIDDIALDVLKFLGPAGPTDPVFISSNGTPFSADNAAVRILKPAADQLKLKGVSWHTFRHTWATLADEAGLTVAERMAVLGHSTAASTLLYTHPSLDGILKKMVKLTEEKK